jgi:hypothetical protein
MSCLDPTAVLCHTRILRISNTREAVQLEAPPNHALCISSISNYCHPTSNGSRIVFPSGRIYIFDPIMFPRAVLTVRTGLGTFVGFPIQITLHGRVRSFSHAIMQSLRWLHHAGPALNAASVCMPQPSNRTT